MPKEDHNFSLSELMSDVTSIERLSEFIQGGDENLQQQSELLETRLASVSVAIMQAIWCLQK